MFNNIIDNHKRLLEEGPLLGAARGIYGDKVKPVHKFGYNPLIGAAEETVWGPGGLYPWQTAASVASIVSTSANDAFGNIGAQTVKIYGLDSNYDLIDETVQLNGLIPVLTTKQFFRIYRMSIRPLVDIDGNVIPGQKSAIGTITASQSAIVRAQIINGNNQTLMGIYTIPAGFTGFLMHGSAGVGQGKDATIKYFVRPYLGVFNLSYLTQLFESNEQRPFTIPQRIEEKSDLDVRAASTAVGVAISANFDVVLVKNAV